MSSPGCLNKGTFLKFAPPFDKDIHQGTDFCQNMDTDNNPCISIIVPIYNCELYLSECVDSLINQTYRNIEIILVDDGSTDRSGHICDNYAAGDSRVFVIHKENGGVSSARNAGMAAVTGKYVTFVDADDWLDLDACERMIRETEDGKLFYLWKYKIAVDGVVRMTSNIRLEQSLGELAADVIESGQRICIRATYSKLYDKGLLEGVSFLESMYIGEDACFLLDVIANLSDINDVKVINEAWYYYRITSGSAVRRYKNDLFEQSIMQYDYIKDCIQRMGVGDTPAVQTAMTWFCWNIFVSLKENVMKSTQNGEVKEGGNSPNEKESDCLRWGKISDNILKARINWPHGQNRFRRICWQINRIPCLGYRGIERLTEVYLKFRRKSDKWIVQLTGCSTPQRPHFSLPRGKHQLQAVIVTMHTENYGNRFQNYAAQEVLRRMSIDVTTVFFEKKEIKEKVKLLIHRLTRYHLSKHPDTWKWNPIREKNFDAFNRKYIPSQRIDKMEENDRYDFYVVGSDQVWNPNYFKDCKGRDEFFLLTFAPQAKKVCLSPSFGVDHLPDEWKPWFKDHLLTFSMLSVREEVGAKIIKELTGRDALVTIDPTLMLDKEEWRRISAMPSGVDCEKAYILTYFLGKHPDGMEKALEQYSDKIGAEAVYHLMDTHQPELYVVGPSEFIYLIDHASLVLTDSFHACVFSFLFGKPFLCYDRQGSVDVAGNAMNMGSRIQTLFEKFGLQRKYVGGRCDTGEDIMDNLLECDYSFAKEALEYEREKLLVFLKEAMRLEET